MDQSKAALSSEMSSFLNPLDASLQACIELDKAIFSQRDLVDWRKAKTFIELIAGDGGSPVSELFHLMEPIEIINYAAQSAGTSQADPNKEYQASIEQLAECWGKAGGNIACANQELLKSMREACWNIHNILLIARNTRLSHD